MRVDIYLVYPDHVLPALVDLLLGGDAWPGLGRDWWDRSKAGL